MHAELSIPLTLLMGFGLTLLRFTGMFVFLPWPGAQAGPTVARVAFAVGCTIALQSHWPRIDAVPTVSQLVAWAVGEAALGLFVGLATAWLAEIFVIGAQALSVQAGYSFASTFDPNTQADSGILQIFAQLAAGLLFFTTGMDGIVIRLLARSLDTCPVGTFILHPSMAQALIRLGAESFVLAARLALPVIGLLFLVDLVMGVVGRVSAQMQIIGLSFPLKMLAALLLLSSLLTVFPQLYVQQSARVVGVIQEYVRQSH
ncbi:MAG: flagellar biosynthetic protein FliR [Bryobacteraceae bacterium]|nr:flagellar biosynthetic protein FliR [Bryobacteraceae bacterium]